MFNPTLLLLLLAHACWACASRPECTEYDPARPIVFENRREKTNCQIAAFGN